ncbi:MAG: hypothetical protein K8I30_11185 [Anaerolineae bacterium]|nr:hypothetical protein [Anaerolineae bacterium]
MQPEQYILLDIVYARAQELEAELKPQPVTHKNLENAPARQYGRLVGRQPGVVKSVVRASKLATESGVYRIG